MLLSWGFSIPVATRLLAHICIVEPGVFMTSVFTSTWFTWFLPRLEWRLQCQDWDMRVGIFLIALPATMFLSTVYHMHGIIGYIATFGAVLQARLIIRMRPPKYKNGNLTQLLALVAKVRSFWTSWTRLFVVRFCLGGFGEMGTHIMSVSHIEEGTSEPLFLQLPSLLQYSTIALIRLERLS
jgi:hypothetical protein